MAFEPDILVTVADTPEIALVAEVRQRIGDFEATEHQLKRFMLGMRCPVGLLVTPQSLWIYRDRYTGYSEESIERVGEFDMTGVLTGKGIESGPEAGRDLEQAVQSWLEELRTQAGLQQLPAHIRRAAEAYIAPALAQGALRAAGPRPLAAR